jgi:predicted amidohydrolase YtcJ
MLSPSEKNFEEFLYKGKYKTDHLNVRSVKLYADGALGSRGALLLEPYEDDKAKTGLFVSELSYIRRISQLADSAGYQVCIHCIGDGANRGVLKIFSEILEKDNDKRWRIEHAQIVHPDDINLFGEYSVIPSIQPTHATSDMYWAEERLGDRINYAYPYRSLLEQNGRLPNGSDFPVESINPVLGFYAASVRKDTQNYPENGFQTEESLTREKALKAMTIWAAKAAFEEDEKGSIETGKFADFVVLDRDIMKVEPGEIYGAKVLMTFSGGKIVYSEVK